MKNLNFNHQEYKDALDIVNKNGGINEIAINDRGQVFCVNKSDKYKYLYNKKHQHILASVFTFIIIRVRTFVNKKAKNVKSDRYHRTSVIIENKVTVEEITPEVINPEIVVDLPLVKISIASPV